MLSSSGERSESRFGSGVPGPQYGHGFGTAPVFLASISTILGAILFLRFGYAVAHVGLWGSLMVIALGHLVTVPTVLAVSEIATNRRVAGGGAYYYCQPFLRREYRWQHRNCPVHLASDLGCLLYRRVCAIFSTYL